MEANLVSMLEGQVPRLKDFPEIQREVAKHAEESKRHGELVESALKGLGEDTSALKDGIAKLTGMLGPMGMAMANDAPVKIVLANFASEHFEIACYHSIRAAAQACGNSEIVKICDQILRDEERMADVLEAAIPRVTREHLACVGVPA